MNDVPEGTIRPYGQHTKTRRVGTFSIPREYIDLYPEQVRACLAGVIVVKAEYAFHWDRIEYVGICDAFTDVPPFLPARHYEAEFAWELASEAMTFTGWR